MERILTSPTVEPVDSGCQCSIGRDKLASAPVAGTTAWDADEAAAERGAYTAPTTRKPGKDPYTGARHVLVTFRFPAHLDSVVQQVFPAQTPLRAMKRKLARLLGVSPSGLVLARGRTALRDAPPLAAVRDPLTDTVVLDVYAEGDATLADDPEAPSAGSSPPDRETHVRFVVVKFKVPTQDDSFTRSYPSIVTVGDVRKNLAELFRVVTEDLEILHGGLRVEEPTLLRELEHDEFGNVELELRRVGGGRVSLERLYAAAERVGDVLQVAVACDPCGDTMRHVNVEIIDCRIKKPYLGGYRNVHSSIEYHHAYTQTQQKPEKVLPENKNERDTQTAEEREKLYDTPYSRATQMCGEQVYVPNVTDRVLAAGHYETYDEMVARLRHHHYASIIQRAYRTYRYRQLVWAWLRSCKEKIKKMKEEERREKEAFETRLKRDLITKTFPRTRQDFDQLYCMVDRWKNAEIARITRLHSKGPKIAEFTLLLDKEIELLRCIESYRVKVKEDSKKLRDKAFLDEISKPVAWFRADGGIVTMDTLESQRARKLRDIYDAFCRNDLTPERRMQLLVDFKYALKEFCHPLTDDIIALLDRECELLVRGCGDRELDFLRRRTRDAVLRFIKTSELNAGATRRREAAELHGMSDGKLYLCEMCNQCKTFGEFPLHTRADRLAACTSCAARGGGGEASGPTPYRLILRAVQREERRRRCWGSLAFVMQERDVAHLVERVWHARSAVSGSGEVSELRLCRWIATHEWAPWNCLLVTATEAAVHARLAAPELTYDEELVSLVRSRHALARQHFGQLLAVDGRLAGSGDWHKVRAAATDFVDAVEPL